MAPSELQDFASKPTTNGSESPDVLARLVQLTRQTKLDARTGNHRADLADSLPDHSRHVRLRVRAGDPREAAVACRSAVRHQSCGEPNLHTNPVRDAQSAAGLGGYSGRLDNDYLDVGSDLATLPLGRRGADSVLDLGVAGDRAATEHHGDELGQTLNSRLTNTSPW